MPDEQHPDSPAEVDDTVIDAAAPTRAAALDDYSAGDAAPEVDDAEADTEPSGGRLISSYGLVSAVLGVLAVAAVVVGLITWSMHRDDVDQRAEQGRVLQTAASWTSVLINLNAENVEKGMQRLRDKTVGELNREFDVALQPYRDVVQRIQSRSTGRIEAVAIESVRDDLDGRDSAEQESSSADGNTSNVMVIATSIAENVGGKPQTVHWALELKVSDVDGRQLISGLRSIR